MKTAQFFQKDSPDKNNSLMNFTKKFEETTPNVEIEQSYQKILEIIEVSLFFGLVKMFGCFRTSTEKSKKSSKKMKTTFSPPTETRW